MATHVIARRYLPDEIVSYNGHFLLVQRCGLALFIYVFFFVLVLVRCAIREAGVLELELGWWVMGGVV